MSKNEKTYEELVEEAMQADAKGWDFSWLLGRVGEESLPWDYTDIVRKYMKPEDRMLDIGTGGGEFLSQFKPLPKKVWATEGYDPNVELAKTRLDPLGIEVVYQFSDEFLPFPNDYFSLVINRHDSFITDEILRVLKPGGIFVTQQVGCTDLLELNQTLGCNHIPYEDWNLQVATLEMDEYCFPILESGEDFPKLAFRDIGAVIFLLRMVSWQIPDFCVDLYNDALRKLHNQIRECGIFWVNSHRFYFVAQKPLDCPGGKCKTIRKL